MDQWAAQAEPSKSQGILRRGNGVRLCTALVPTLSPIFFRRPQSPFHRGVRDFSLVGIPHREVECCTCMIRPAICMTWHRRAEPLRSKTRLDPKDGQRSCKTLSHGEPRPMQGRAGTCARPMCMCSGTSFRVMNDSPCPKVTRTVVPSFQAQKAPVPTDAVVALSNSSSTWHVDSEHATP